jgi:hypothetical protein
MVAEGDDRLPSTTASDWVTYADHVVVATAASEHRLRFVLTEDNPAPIPMALNDRPRMED